MQQDEAMTYSNEAKDIIERAKRGKPMTDVYDLKYLFEVVNRQGVSNISSLRDKQMESFGGYSRNVMLFAEGKHFSKKSDLGSMANKISAFEEEQASSSQNHDWQDTHTTLRDLWVIIHRLV